MTSFSRLWVSSRLVWGNMGKRAMFLSSPRGVPRRSQRESALVHRHLARLYFHPFWHCHVANMGSRGDVIDSPLDGVSAVPHALVQM